MDKKNIFIVKTATTHTSRKAIDIYILRYLHPYHISSSSIYVLISSSIVPLK